MFGLLDCRKVLCEDGAGKGEAAALGVDRFQEGGVLGVRVDVNPQNGTEEFGVEEGVGDVAGDVGCGVYVEAFAGVVGSSEDCFETGIFVG